jgi:hypothetical protein
MSAFEVVEPAELAILANALNEHCARHRIAAAEDRERIALKVMSLFRRGLIDPDQLSAELERVG